MSTMSSFSQVDGGGRRIEVVVTDVRLSLWDTVPKEDQRQKDYKVVIVIYANSDETSYKNLKTGIQAKIRIKDYEIANPDFGRITPENASKLRKGDHLILVDPDQMKFPFPYSHTVNYTPHSRALTNQDGKFGGTDEHNAAAFALAELVDNSLSATVSNPAGQRNIEIHFYDNGPYKSSLHVLDNGYGMDCEMLKLGLKLKAPKEGRKGPFSAEAVPEETEIDENEAVHPLYLNSNISKFGAGLKQAAFFLGEEARIMTKTSRTDNVCEVRLSEAVMEQKELDEDADPWKEELFSGTAGEVRDPRVSPIIRKLITERERCSPSFTHVVIQNIRQLSEESSVYNLLRVRNSGTDEKHPTIEKQLSHIYHYYLHGRDGEAASSDKNIKINLTVHRHNAEGRELSCTNLFDFEVGDVVQDLEDKFVKSAAPHPYRFTIEVASFNKTKDAVALKVGGIIRYHPFLYDKETKPGGVLTAKQQDEDDQEIIEIDEVNLVNGQKSKEEQCRKKKEFFHVWWNGRLIPRTKLESFEWCSPSCRIKSTDKLFKPFGRISGSLFFDSAVSDITDNKLQLTTTDALYTMFQQKTIGAQASTFIRVEEGVVGGKIRLKPKRMTGNPKKNFQEWLAECHKYDKQVLYSGPMPPSKMTLPSQIPCHLYKTATWENMKFVVGQSVKLINTNITLKDNASDIYGIIKSFNVPTSLCLKYLPPGADSSQLPPPDRVDAPLSKFVLELQPSSYYAGDDKMREKEMRLIDRKVVGPAAKQAIHAQLKELEQIKLQILNWGSSGAKLEDGDKVPLDEILIKLVAFDVVNEQGNSLAGQLPHYESIKLRKSIHMVARVYMIRKDGSRVLYYTSSICDYPKYKGYYFKTLDLKQMSIDGLGDFVITFRSFIDLNKSTGINPNVLPQPQTRSTRSRSSNITPSPSNSNRIEPVRDNIMEADPDYEVEWEMEVDSLGRKILEEGKTKIRMPFHEIFFSIVAGSPQTLSIEEFGEEGTLLRIGQPFTIILSLKDSLGNVTGPKNLEALSTLQTTITALPSKKFPNLSVQFTYKKVYFADGSLVIEDVVAEGHLLGAEWKECKVEVKLELHKKTYKTTQPGNCKFYYGRPHRLQAEDNTTPFENGSKPGITCFVLDSSGNIIPYVDDKKKPIIIQCAISKEGEDEVLFTGNVLAAITPQLMDDFVSLPDLKTGQHPSLKLRCQLTLSGIEPVSLAITAIPSTRPEIIRLYLRNDQDSIEIQDEDELVRKVKEKLDFSFKLFDGQGKQVAFDSKKHEILITWFDGSAMRKDDGNEVLPSFIVSSKVRIKRKMATTLKIAGFEASLSHIFYVTSIPLKLHAVKAHFLVPSIDGDVKIVSRDEDVKVPIGEALPDLVVNLLDAYDNVIMDVRQDDISHLDISVDEPFELDFESSLGTACQLPPTQECSFMIKNLRLENQAKGTVPLTISYKIFQDVLNIDLIPGLPFSLAFEINGELLKRRGKPLSLPNESDIRIRVVLLDASKNKTVSREESMMLSLSFGPENEWDTGNNNRSHSSQVELKKGDGFAEFGTFKVKTRQKIQTSCPMTNDPCVGKCFGKRQFVKVDGTLQGKSVSSLVNFHVTARPEEPFNLVVDLLNRGSFSYEAGSSFHNLTVTLEAEDGKKFIPAQKEHVILELTKIGDLNEMLILSAENVQEGVYTFGNVPTQSGLYDATFVYNNGARSISHTVPEKLQIRASRICSLKPEQEFQNLSVSNDPENPGSRVILQNFKLMLRDKYENICTPLGNGRDLNGVVNITFVNDKDTRLLESPDLETEFELRDGVAEFPPLIVQPNLNLENFTKHVLRFTATMEKTGQEIPYNLEFTFFNNVRVQQEIRGLETLSEELNKNCIANRGEIAKIGNKRKTLLNDFDEKKKVVLQGRAELTRILGSSASHILENLKSAKDLEIRQKVIASNISRLSNEVTIKCTIQRGPWSDEPHVLGTVGLLAKVKYSEGRPMQCVLSWHLQGNLGVIVVEQQRKGNDLRNKFPRQKFMLIDIVKPRNHSWNERDRECVLRGPGNPIYARFLLVITTEPEKRSLVQKVFDEILGNVIVVDTLPDATMFMGQYNATCAANKRCPTILTRDGHRLSSSGIIGGNTGSAPELERLTLKLGLAPNPEIAIIQKELNILPQLKRDTELTASAAQELQQFDHESKPKVETLQKNIKDTTEERDRIIAKLREMRNDHRSPANGTRTRPAPSPGEILLAKRQRMQ